MAIEHAVFLYNRMPGEDYGMSKYKLWSRSFFLSSKEILSTCHNWGAPAYIL